MAVFPKRVKSTKNQKSYSLNLEIEHSKEENVDLGNRPDLRKPGIYVEKVLINVFNLYIIRKNRKKKS
jgi:hypothetical protein